MDSPPARAASDGVFARELRRRNPDPRRRRWLFVAYDQLTDAVGPLAREDPRELGIVLVESAWKARRRPYHKQKLALVLANLRQFALEQATRGVAVRRLVAEGSYRHALEPVARELGPLRLMRPAERELRADLGPLLVSGALEMLPHEGWLTTAEQFARSAPKGPPWRMDAFYRLVRRETGVLMTADGRPEGGKFSFDPENRQRWSGRPSAAEPPRFPDDPVKTEVAELIEHHHPDHPGRLDLASLPTRRADAETLWTWACTNCLPHFGPYEDAMSLRSRGLFHTRISALLNLHRLLPIRILQDVAALPVPLASREGFIRQVLGWREFIRHVHETTDGFRRLPGRRRGPAGTDEIEPGPAPSHLGASAPLPPAWWGTPSGLRCLDEVVRSVWEEGYSHHITRLMVLCNLATLLELSPREVTDWFWAAYTDAYDWVVEPNVLGMGTFALGDLFTTKPYVSGAAYIARMSDYCGGCAFDPGRTCPITPLYWAFLQRHANLLSGNPRMKLPVSAARRRSAVQRRRDAAVYRVVRRRLDRGMLVLPGDLPPQAE